MEVIVGGIALLVLVPLSVVLSIAAIRKAKLNRDALDSLTSAIQGIHDPDMTPVFGEIKVLEARSEDRDNDLMSRIDRLEASLAAVPGKVLHSIQGSVNNAQGKLGELAAHMKLKAQYDKVLPATGITDFIGIRFPTVNDPGEICFVEVKSGGARLSGEQKAMKEIINKGKIRFEQVQISA